MKNFITFNKALLSKLARKLMHKDSFLFRLLWARFV